MFFVESGVYNYFIHTLLTVLFGISSNMSTRKKMQPNRRIFYPTRNLSQNKLSSDTTEMTSQTKR